MDWHKLKYKCPINDSKRLTVLVIEMEINISFSCQNGRDNTDFDGKETGIEWYFVGV